MKFTLYGITLTVYFFTTTTVSAQDDTAHFNKLDGKYYTKLSQKLSNLNRQFDKKTIKYLHKIERQEIRLYRRLARKDSLVAKELFGKTNNIYNNLPIIAKEEADRLNNLSKVYSSKLDSLGTALHFLQTNRLSSMELQGNIKNTAIAITLLQEKLSQTDQVAKFLKQRKKQLTEQLEKLGLTKKLKQFNKQVYYYQQQIAEYRQLLDDPSQWQEKLLGILAEVPAFRDFFASNSQLGSLFSLPGSGNNNNTALAAGLQTRASIIKDMQDRFGRDASVEQMIHQNIESAQSEVKKMQDKLEQYMPAGGGSDEDLPDFKPNYQKTKSLLDRLEFGTNIQSSKPNGYFPVTSEIGLSIGYKLNDISIVGVGASYKMGWGQNIRHINISNQGIGLRSFFEWKLKGSLWLSGGYEMNYYKEFERIEELHNMNAWQKRGLVGISKVISSRAKFLKRIKFQLLWDFLSYHQEPKAQPLVFRVGYSFR